MSSGRRRALASKAGLFGVWSDAAALTKGWADTTVALDDGELAGAWSLVDGVGALHATDAKAISTQDGHRTSEE